MTKELHETTSKKIIKLSKELYSKKVIFHAVYVLIEENYFTVDCDETHFIVELLPKETCTQKELEKKELEFHKELIEANAYFEQLEQTSGVRQKILEKALFSQKALEEINNKK